MFKCKNTQRSLHVGNVCDVKEDCPYGDDELLCHLKDTLCPLNCDCLLLAIICSNISYLNMETESHFPYFYVYISDTNPYLMEHLHRSFRSALIIKIPRNYLEEICRTFPTGRLLLLDAESNFIRKLYKNCFASHWLLQALIINDNHISFLEPGSFYSLSHLKYLNMSYNPLLNRVATLG